MLEEGILSNEALERATRHATEHKTTVPEAAAAMGVVTHRDIAIARAAVGECPFVDLENYDLDLKNAALLPRSAADKLFAFPLFNLGKAVTVAMADPLDLK